MLIAPMASPAITSRPKKKISRGIIQVYGVMKIYRPAMAKIAYEPPAVKINLVTIPSAWLVKRFTSETKAKEPAAKTPKARMASFFSSTHMASTAPTLTIAQTRDI
jgi:hypothetical protein